MPRKLFLRIIVTLAVSALKAVKAHLTDVKKHLNDWEKGDPCLGNWTGVICCDAIGVDGYFHIKELYVNLYKHFFWFLLLVFWTVYVLGIANSVGLALINFILHCQLSTWNIELIYIYIYLLIQCADDHEPLWNIGSWAWSAISTKNFVSESKILCSSKFFSKHT